MTIVVWLTEGTWPACVDAARTLRAEPVRTPLAKIASDHLPLIVDFDLSPSIAIAADT